MNFFRPFWHWGILVQAGLTLVLVAIAFVMHQNLTANLQQANLSLDFSFLNSQASFNIRESLIAFQPTDTYARALLVGLLNTIRAAIATLLLATVVGFTVGLCSLSGNWLVRRLAIAYVESARNLPLLLQMSLWYGALFLTLTPPKQLSLAGIAVLSIEGLTIPALPLHISAELCALILGLGLYVAAFIAEIVRGGIAAVPTGQWEAARALGLSPRAIVLTIVMPQAMRAILPPLTIQYLNILKNSSLAIAVGYEDIYAIASTTFNQTGRSIEVVCILVAVYFGLGAVLTLSLQAVRQK